MALAEHAGGTWPRRCHAAARACEMDSLADGGDVMVAGEDLLRLTAEILENHAADLSVQGFTRGLTVAALLGQIVSHEDAGDFGHSWGPNRNRPIDARGVAALLRPFGVLAARTKVSRDRYGPRCYLLSDVRTAMERHGYSEQPAGAPANRSAEAPAGEAEQPATPAAEAPAGEAEQPATPAAEAPAGEAERPRHLLDALPLTLTEARANYATEVDAALEAGEVVADGCMLVLGDPL